ncbi:MAG: serine/threonine-protein phosphatase [Clostridia bacterium]|nr:serine/threonine-protein phosphatase [Clostridia bacterium]
MNISRPLTFNAAAHISLGKVRSNNEDNFYLGGEFLSAEEYDSVNEEGVSRTIFAPERRLLVGVCDGMGGEEYGEVASLIAAKSMASLESALQSVLCLNPEKRIAKHFDKVSREIYNKRLELGASCIGTTCAALYLDCDGAIAASVGDSRIYQIRGSKLRQLTIDDTELQYYINAGILTPEEGRDHPASNRLTQYLGAAPDGLMLGVHYAEIGSVSVGDIFLLCSDGLTDMVDDTAILELCGKSKAPADIASALVEAALTAGGRDNITAVVVCVQ